MKSYIQGLITGGVFVFAFMVFIGAKDLSSNDAGTYQFCYYAQGSYGDWWIMDTQTGEMYNVKKNLPDNSFQTLDQKGYLKASVKLPDDFSELGK